MSRVHGYSWCGQTRRDANILSRSESWDCPEQSRSCRDDVVNTVFGDRFTSWINTELRIKAGLTYSCRGRGSIVASYADRSSLIPSHRTRAPNRRSIRAAENTEAASRARPQRRGIEDPLRLISRAKFPPQIETNGTNSPELLPSWNSSVLDEREVNTI